MVHSRSLFLYLCLLTINILHMASFQFCQCVNSNRGPLASESTTLPTEPQPLPYKVVLMNLNS